MVSERQRFSIRLATPEDITDLCNIERKATAKFGTIPELADLVDGDVLPPSKVQGWLSNGPIWMVLDHNDGDRPVGFAAAEPKDNVLYLSEISVVEDMNGLGVGSMLMNNLFDYARVQARSQPRINGHRVAQVSLTTYPDVPWNGQWYIKRGFREVEAETLGPAHMTKMRTDKEERDLVRPGYRRCCMLWEEQIRD